MMYRAELKRRKAEEKRQKALAWNIGVSVTAILAGALNHDTVRYEDVFGADRDGPTLTEEESSNVIINIFKAMGAEIVYKNREEGGETCPS